MPNASPHLYIVRKIHEIKTYLQAIELVVSGLKTELDLTRSLLYRTWLKHQNNCKIAASKDTMPASIEFLTKKVDSQNMVLTVQESQGSNYEKICIQIKELGFVSGNKVRDPSPKVNTSQVAYEHIVKFLGDLPYESFYIMLLDSSNQLIKTVCVSEGGISGTLVDLKKIYKIALDNYTTSMILSHNHPSGNLQPSGRDGVLTKRIIEAGKLLDIIVIDHLIIGRDSYYSFADEGLMG